MEARRRGHCLCAEVRFETRGEPGGVTLCDCASCRRAAGAAGVAWSSWRPEQVRWEGRAPAQFESSPGRRRGFCDRCGTTLSWAMDEAPAHVDLAVAAFADAAALTPTSRIWCADRLPWQDLEPELPRHRGWRTEEEKP